MRASDTRQRAMPGGGGMSRGPLTVDGADTGAVPLRGIAMLIANTDKNPRAITIFAREDDIAPKRTRGPLRKA